MPAIMGMLGGLLLSMVAGMVGRALMSLGLAIVTYYGISQAINFLKDIIVTQLAALPIAILQMMQLMKVGTAISIVFSAVAVSMLLNGLDSDTFKRWILT